MQAWGFTYKTNIVWYKTRRDGGPDGRGCGFYFRNVTELLLFGVRGSLRTLKPGRTQVNLLPEQKREHSHKPDGIRTIIEACSPPPYLELFARRRAPNWECWGDEIN
jgi:N6-adenosine-specific RNA methylase IME4